MKTTGLYFDQWGWSMEFFPRMLTSCMFIIHEPEPVLQCHVSRHVWEFWIKNAYISAIEHCVNRINWRTGCFKTVCELRFSTQWYVLLVLSWPKYNWFELMWFEFAMDGMQYQIREEKNIYLSFQWNTSLNLSPPFDPNELYSTRLKSN